MSKLFYLCSILAFCCFAVLAFTLEKYSGRTGKETHQIVVGTKKEAPSLRQYTNKKNRYKIRIVTFKKNKKI
jgi:hypothetical protein